jgi:hypothetical protein
VRRSEREILKCARLEASSDRSALFPPRLLDRVRSCVDAVREWRADSPETFHEQPQLIWLA